MTVGDWLVIAFVILIAILTGLYFLYRWSSKKQAEQQSMIARNKMAADIYVIDKKHDKAGNVNLPKAVMDGMPKMYKFLKMYFVMAKIGPQIVTLMCDKNVYNALTVKKTAKVELAGIYIVSVKGMKTPAQLKQMKKEKKAKAAKDKPKFKLPFLKA